MMYSFPNLEPVRSSVVLKTSKEEMMLIIKRNKVMIIQWFLNVPKITQGEIENFTSPLTFKELNWQVKKKT